MSFLTEILNYNGISVVINVFIIYTDYIKIQTDLSLTNENDLL